MFCTATLEDAQRDRRFHDTGRHREPSQGRQHEGEAVRRGEGRDDLHDVPYASGAEQHPVPSHGLGSGRCGLPRRVGGPAREQPGAARVARWVPLVTALTVLVLCLVAQPARAHAVSLGQSKISQDGDTVRYELAVEYAELVKRLGVRPADPARPEPSDAQRTADLVGLRSELAAYLDGVLRVSLDGGRCAPKLDTIEVEPFQGELYAILSSTYRCPGRSGSLVVEYDLFFDAISDAERSSHANVADYDVGDETGRFVFEPDARELTVGEDDLPATAGRFVGLGFTHILAGLDHVLFVLAQSGEGGRCGGSTSRGVRATGDDLELLGRLRHLPVGVGAPDRQDVRSRPQAARELHGPQVGGGLGFGRSLRRPLSCS
jgi:hypothetical protein